MTHTNLKLTAKELELLSSLASDQMFRREFIDPRMPGYKANPVELSLGKQLAQRLRAMIDRTKGAPVPQKRSSVRGTLKAERTQSAV